MVGVIRMLPMPCRCRHIYKIMDSTNWMQCVIIIVIIIILRGYEIGER